MNIPNENKLTISSMPKEQARELLWLALFDVFSVEFYSHERDNWGAQDGWSISGELIIRTKPSNSSEQSNKINEEMKALLKEVCMIEHVRYKPDLRLLLKLETVLAKAGLLND